MDHDTAIGGPNQKFPVTSHSAIIAARSAVPEVREGALEAIFASYWKPAYKYIRIKWQASNEDAKDLTQSFFADAIEKNHFRNYDSEKASFRTFFRICLDRFVANRLKAEQRLKRGGGVSHSSLDFAGAEAELTVEGRKFDSDPEEYFYREWVRSLFSLALDSLYLHFKKSDREICFKLFELYDLDDQPAAEVSYASLAVEFGLSLTDVTNYLAAARREFRRIVLEKLRELTASEGEFRNEARKLMGVEIR